MKRNMQEFGENWTIISDDMLADRNMAHVKHAHHNTPLSYRRRSKIHMCKLYSFSHVNLNLDTPRQVDGRVERQSDRETDCNTVLAGALRAVAVKLQRALNA